MKTIVVTGGSRGIGREICLEFAKRPNRIVICYHNNKEKAEEVAQIAERLGAIVMICKVDVADYSQCEELAKKVTSTFGNVDVLVNSAGEACYQLLADTNEQNIRHNIDVNLVGTINVCRAFADNMLQNRSGSIINISSMWGIYGGSGESVYSASKAGVIGFSKALAKELGLMGIRVNVVAPGTILTDMTRGLGKATLNDLASQTSLGRIGQPQEVAKVVQFLASEDASYITGQVIEVNGGI